MEYYNIFIRHRELRKSVMANSRHGTAEGESPPTSILFEILCVGQAEAAIAGSACGYSGP